MIEKVAAKPRNVRMFFLKIGTIPFIYSVENLVNKSPRNPRKFLVFINGVSKKFFSKTLLFRSLFTCAFVQTKLSGSVF